MFTGIIQAVGRVSGIENRGGDVHLAIDAGGLDLAGVRIGDSIAVNGCCLTVVALHGPVFEADVSRETLALTTLGALVCGAPVNLEKSLTITTPLGGHLVTGHVDGIGTVIERRADARSVRFGIRLPAGLDRYVARKGSIAVDGVSLTVNEVEGMHFHVNIVPHTLERTVLGGWTIGTRVNIEVDIVARYVERLLSVTAGGAGSELTLAKLIAAGFADER